MKYTDLQALKTEINTDPLTRGYSGMTDLQIADDLNDEYRPVDSVPIERILKFLLLDNTYKIDDGTDMQDRSIWQRMKEVVSLAATPTEALANPWGSASLGNITEIRQIKTHQLYEFFTLSAQGGLAVDLTDSNFKVYLSGAQSAGCMSEAQETAFLALGNDLQSRGHELGIGHVYAFDVTEAKALP